MSDTSGSGFGRFVPGFDFLQGLAAQGSSAAAPGLGGGLPHLASWIAPTFNVEDIEKRIEELKAVHFWLDQNTKALAATIQALEVQKMTLATLKTMNFSLGEVAEALKVKEASAAPSPFTFGPAVAPVTPPVSPGAAAPAPSGHAFAGLEIPPRTYGSPAAPPPWADAPDASERSAATARQAPGPAGEAGATGEASETGEAGQSEPGTGRASRRGKPARRSAASPAPVSASGGVDPMAWWGALSQQFQQIAATAMSDLGRAGAVPGAQGPGPAAGGPATPAVAPASGRPAGDRSRATTRRTAAAPAAPRARSAGGQGARSGPVRPARTGRPAASPVAPAPRPAAAAPRRKAAAPAGARSAKAAGAPQPLMAGDWLLPAAMFPALLNPAGGAKAAPKRGRQSAPAAARKPAPAARRKPAPAKAPRARRN